MDGKLIGRPEVPWYNRKSLSPKETRSVGWKVGWLHWKSIRKSVSPTGTGQLNGNLVCLTESLLVQHRQSDFLLDQGTFSPTEQLPI